MKTLHPLITQYVQRHGLAGAVDNDGQALLLVDDQYRVTMTSDSAGWMVLMARVAGLPQRLDARQRLCVDVALAAAPLLSAHASTCVVDGDGAALWLQQMVHPDSTAVEVEHALAGYLNALAFWTREFGDGSGHRGRVQ